MLPLVLPYIMSAFCQLNCPSSAEHRVTAAILVKAWTLTRAVKDALLVNFGLSSAAGQL